ncbi:MAG: aminoacyl-tRNA hydrolase [Treponema sp.]|nr:aminoacyl-tRNA hydrolase [Treponema sp.]
MNKEELRKSIEENCSFSFSRSGGKGGQNVNKVNTKVHVSVPLGKISGLSEAEMQQLILRLKSHINSRLEVFADAEDSRSQEQNRTSAVERLIAKIISASQVRKKRRKTHPTAASRERRLKSKKLRSSLKKERGYFSGTKL